MLLLFAACRLLAAKAPKQSFYDFFSTLRNVRATTRVPNNSLIEEILHGQTNCFEHWHVSHPHKSNLLHLFIRQKVCGLSQLLRYSLILFNSCPQTLNYLAIVYFSYFTKCSIRYVFFGHNWDEPVRVFASI